MELLKRLTSLVSAAALLSIPPALLAQSLSEADAKAAVVYNLATFVQWPEQRRDLPSLSICVLGKDAVISSLAGLQGAKVNDRVVNVRELRPDDDPAACDVLYIPGTSERSAATLQRIGDAPVLTVGDGLDLLREGGAVRFFVERSRLRLEIELTVVERAQVKISPKVLRLARVLRNGRQVNAEIRP